MRVLLLLLLQCSEVFPQDSHEGSRGSLGIGNGHNDPASAPAGAEGAALDGSYERGLLMHSFREQKIVSPFPSSEDRFGRKVAIYDNVTVVGAFFDDYNNKVNAGDIRI